MCSIYLSTDRRLLARMGEPISQLLDELERRSNTHFEGQNSNYVAKYVGLRLGGHVGCGHVTCVFR